MTAYQLQKDIGEEIERILKDIVLKDIKKEPAKIKAYPQQLPKRLQTIQSDMDEEMQGISIMPGEEEDEDPYPYCIVIVDSGKLKTAQSAHEISTVIVFGIFDDGIECQGHQVLLNMFHRIAERFTKDPVLKERYRMNSDAGIEWILDTEDRYPYYFGAMEMTWDTFFVRREDRYV